MKYIITSGPMEMEIDNVRKIKNSSTGKLGATFAERLVEHQMTDVVYIHTPGAIIPDVNVKNILINNHQELQKALSQEITDESVVIHAMAVSDFMYGGNVSIDQLAAQIKENMSLLRTEEDIRVIIEKAMHKTNKLPSTSDQVILLKQSDKIIDLIKQINAQVKLVGFKLLANVDEKYLMTVANDMKKRANCDLVVANLQGEVSLDKHKAYIISNNEVIEASTKRQIADIVIQEMEKK